MGIKDVYNTNKLFHYRDDLKKIANGEIVPPAKLQIDLTNKCNNRCVWCFYDIHNISEFSRKDSLSEEAVNATLESFKKIGGRSIEWTGGGEPTVSPIFLSVVKKAESLGLRQSLVTNGKLLGGDIADAVTEFDWVRISLNSATQEMYKKQHGNDSYYKVIDNICAFALIKNRDCVFGISMIADNVNYVDMYNMTEAAYYWGADNVRIGLAMTPGNDKIFSDWDKVDTLMRQCKTLENNKFRVFTMNNRIDNLAQKTGGGRCYYHHLAVSLGGNGAVYPCCHFKYLPQYNFGNVNEESFEDIWNGEKRRKFIETTGEDCKASCWMTDKNELADYIVKEPEDIPHLAFP